MPGLAELQFSLQLGAVVEEGQAVAVPVALEPLLHQLREHLRLQQLLQQWASARLAVGDVARRVERLLERSLPRAEEHERVTSTRIETDQIANGKW